MNELDVYVNGVLSGKLYKEHDHSYIFRYVMNEAGAFVSLTMPVRVKDYEYQVLHPIFQMNLPEGYNLEILRRKFAKLIELDDMALLSLVGANQIGRIAVAEPGAKPRDEPVLALMDDRLLGTRGAQALLTALVEEYVPGAGISGVQPKIVSAHTAKGKVLLQTVSHIYKSSTEYPLLSANEYFCLRACRAAGVAVAETALSGDGQVLRIKRFDASADGTRLGFEEAAVLRGLSRHGKYEGSYEKMYSSLLCFISKLHRRADSESLFRMIAMNVALRNGDAHLKNFGVIYPSVDEIRLAPAYDVVTTCVYMPKDLMALSMEESRDWPDVKRLMRFARGPAGLAPARAKAIMKDCTTGILRTMAEVRRFAARKPIYRKLAESMCKHWSLGLESLGHA